MRPSLTLSVSVFALLVVFSQSQYVRAQVLSPSDFTGNRPASADDGSRERRLQLPGNLENALRNRDSVEREHEAQQKSEEERKRREDPTTNRRQQSNLQSTRRNQSQIVTEEERQRQIEDKQRQAAGLPKEVKDEQGLRPGINDRNSRQNERMRTGNNPGMGAGGDNAARREAMNDEAVVALPRRVIDTTKEKEKAADLNRATAKAPTIESQPSHPMYQGSNARTGRAPPNSAIGTAGAATRQLSTMRAGSSAAATSRVKTNQASQNRYLTHSELAIVSGMNASNVLMRAVPAKPYNVPLVLTRGDSRGRTLPAPNPYTAGGVINPISGVITPRIFRKVEPVNLIGAFNTDNQPLKAHELEDMAYAPLGIRAGAFIANPGLDISGGFATKPNSNATDKGSFFTTFTPELRLESDFSRHAVSADFRGSVSALNEYSSHRPDFQGRVGVRLDIQRDQTLDLNVNSRVAVASTLPSHYTMATGVTVTGEPLAFTQGVGATYTKDFNRLIVALRGTVDRTSFETVSLSDGSSIIGDDRAFNTLRGTLRVGYRLSEDIRPFVEGFSEKRVFDTAVVNGFEQGSNSYGAKVGVRFENPKMLLGELAVGVQHRNNLASSAGDVTGVLLDSNLIWLASGLTHVRFNAKTAFDESALSGISSIYRREAGIQVDHALRRYMIASARFTYGHEQFQGSARSDHRFGATAGLTYKLSRTIALRGEYKFEKLASYGATDSTGKAVDGSYNGHTVLVGVKFTK